MRAYKDFFRNYFNWKGRTGRRGFWLVVLINAVILFLLQQADRFIAVNFLGFTIQEINELKGIYPLTFIFSLLTLIPGITLAIRRLHDINKAGWWALLAFVPVLGNIILIIFACFESVEDNRFGPKPPEGYTS